MGEEQEQREKLVVKSDATTSLLDLITNTADIVVDAVMEGGLLGEIPLFGLVFKTGKVAKNVTDRIFVEKVGSFMQPVSTVSDEAREKFRQRIENDSSYRREVEETLLLLLDRQDHLGKPPMLGKLFLRHMEGNLSYDEFLRLARCVDRASVQDLHELPNYYANFESLSFQTVQDLYSSGLASIDSGRFGSSVLDDPLVRVVRNDAGARLAEILAAN